MRSRARPLLLALVALVLGIALALQLFLPKWRAQQARAANATLHAHWKSPTNADESTTYAAAFISAHASDEERVSAAAWSELLAAAGVPEPAIVSVDSLSDSSGFRLLVGKIGAGGDLAALAASGRAVIAVEPDGASALQGRTAVWKLGGAAIQVPLAGQPGRSLVAEAGEEAAMVSDAGETLALVRHVGRGGVLRMGIDVARGLLRLRQGDPGLAGSDRDGNGSLQPADLLPDSSRFAQRPFADELVDAMLTALDGLGCPLPRTAGLPGADPVVVLTSDQDYVDQDIVSYMAERLAQADAHATFMLTDPGLGAPADLKTGKRPLLGADAASDLLGAGHDLGVHPFMRVPGDVMAVAAAMHTRTGLAPLTARNHHLRWRGFLDVPAAEVEAGILMDLNFMAVCEGTLPCASFPGGTSRAIRFIDPHGRRLPLLQQTTAVDDYSLRAPALQGGPESRAAMAAAATALSSRALQMLARAAAVEAPLVVNAHPVFFATSSEWLTPFLKPGIKVLSAAQWLDFALRRRQSTIVSRSCDIAPTAKLQPGIRLRAPSPGR